MNFEKWTMISLALVAVSLTVGVLIQVVHGFVDGNNNGKDDVQEWLDSVRNDMSLENQQGRYMLCKVYNGTWSGSNSSAIWNGYSCDIEIK